MGESDMPSASGEDLYSDDRIKVEDTPKNDTEADVKTEIPTQPKNGGPSSDNEAKAPDVVANEPAVVSADKPERPLTLQERYDKVRAAKGLPPIPRPPNRSGELEEGDVMLHNNFSRFVIKRNNTAVKYGSDDIMLGEVEAMRFVQEAGIPVPEVISFGNQEGSGNSSKFIEMEYIEGDTLESVFGKLSEETRLSIAHQLRDMIKIMRSLPPPPNFIGAFSRKELREFRKNDVFRRPPCRTEEDFNNYLTEDACIPASVKRGFLEQIGTNHKVVFSHCDLAARNIMVRDGRIVALLDWETCGWYPEYWEYVKFYHMAGREPFWRTYADEVFPELYSREVVLYTGLFWYQDSFDSTRVVDRVPVKVIDATEKNDQEYDVPENNANTASEAKGDMERKDQEDSSPQDVVNAGSDSKDNEAKPAEEQEAETGEKVAP
ncbi:hypothetical protein PWT90_07512 [Aphanocladium album]|nr:hypothetical protein PWT90_07512 [Aphanocladium album]